MAELRDANMQAGATLGKLRPQQVGSTYESVMLSATE